MNSLFQNTKMVRLLVAILVAAFTSSPGAFAQKNPGFRLRKSEDDNRNAAFIADYHNKSCAAVVDTIDHIGSASLAEILGVMFFHLKREKEFPSFSTDEMVSLVERNLGPRGSVGIKEMEKMLKAQASTGGAVMEALLEVVGDLDSYGSIDEIIDIVKAVADKYGSGNDLAQAAIVAEVGKASESFWTNYFSGDRRRLAPRWLNILIGDIVGAVVGTATSGPVGGVILGAATSIAVAKAEKKKP